MVAIYFEVSGVCFTLDSYLENDTFLCILVVSPMRTFFHSENQLLCYCLQKSVCAMCTLFWACLSCSALTDLIATHSIVIRSGNSIVKTVERLPHIPTIQNPLQKHINIDFVLESVAELFERKKEKKTLCRKKVLEKKDVVEKRAKLFFYQKFAFISTR